MALLLNAGDTVQRSYSYTKPSPNHISMPQECGDMTANLFDKAHFTFSDDATIVYVPIYVGDGIFTLSSTIPETTTKDVFFLSGSVTSGASSSGNGVSITTTRTRTSVDGYVTVATRYNNRYKPSEYEYMLNSGSTDLPYEPYGYKITLNL